MQHNDRETILENRFANYYILRWFWKRNDNQVGELFRALFPSERAKGEGSKNIFDRILRLDEVNIGVTKSRELYEKTGIGAEYLSGIALIYIPSLDITDWCKFISLRKKQSKDKAENGSYNGKLTELKSIEKKIHVALEKAYHDNARELRDIAYFTQNGQKRDKEREVSEYYTKVKAALKLDRSNLTHLESYIKSCKLPELEKYESVLSEHLKYLRARMTIIEQQNKLDK